MVFLAGCNATLPTVNVPVDKDFGVSRYLTDYITPNEYEVKKIADSLKKSTIMETVKADYEWFKNGYTYVNDEHISFSNGNTTLLESSDFYQPAWLSLAIIKKFGHFEGDCEDGSILLESILRAQGIEAYAVMGNLEFLGQNYGHVWIIYKVNGETYLLDSVDDQPFSPVIWKGTYEGVVYKPILKWNERGVWQLL
jgi:transglutaminase-like putative cysteine protease